MRSTPTPSSSRNTANNSCAACSGRAGMRRCVTPVATPDGTEREYTASLIGLRAQHVERGAQHGRRASTAAGRAAHSAMRASRAPGPRHRPALRAACGLRSRCFRASARRGATAPDARPSNRRLPIRCRAGPRRRRAPEDRAASNSSATCCAVVGLMRPKRFALGAAMPATPASRAATSSACATEWAGQRNPIVAWPPAAAPATPDLRATMTVRGPGQNASNRRSATGVTVAAKAGTPSRSATWTMSGWPVGRPLRGEDLRDGVVVVGTGAQTVDGLGRKRHEVTGGEAIGGVADGSRIVAVAQHRQARGPPCAYGASCATGPGCADCQGPMPTIAAARAATASASAALAAVTVRWPILRPDRASRLP